jgi:hypothetical protein
MPKDTGERIVRAVKGIQPSEACAVCFWCGFIYQQYDRDTEEAHLLLCPEYPAEQECSPLAEHRCRGISQQEPCLLCLEFAGQLPRVA